MGLRTGGGERKCGKSDIPRLGKTVCSGRPRLQALKTSKGKTRKRERKTDKYMKNGVIIEKS